MTNYKLQITYPILWAGVWLVGALIRLYNLGAAPLSPVEVNEALAALTGTAGAASSGLLVGANRLLFWLLGASDALARLLPALAGSLLPLTAWLFSRHLGRRGALAAAGLFAISPSLVFFSRTASGTILSATAALALLGALLRAQESGDRRWLLAAGGALGMGFASGDGFFSLTLVMALATLITRSAGIWRGLGGRRPLALALAVMLLGSTTFFFFPAGLGVTADGLAQWLAGFELRWAVVFRPFSILLIYEMLALLFGLLGLVWAFWRGNNTVKTLACWTLLGLGLGLLRPSQPDAPLLTLIPLALLAGAFLSSVLTNMQKPPVGATAAALTVLGAHIFISLGQYARHAASNPERAGASLLVGGISTILVAGVVALIWTYSQRLARQSLMVALVVIFSIYSWGKAWELGHTHQADPRELWVEEATAPGARILVETLKITSERSTRSPYTLPLTVQSDDPILRWYLRDFADVTWVDALQPAVISEAVVTPVEEQNPLLGDSYLGMDLALRVEEPAGTDVPSLGQVLRWLLLRDAPVPVASERIVVWIRQDVALVQ